MSDDPLELIVADAPAWRDWLRGHHDQQSGVWLVIAKKGAGGPTALTYEQAVEEALCHGWIDGQSKRRDDATFRQRFTPRRARSVWSQSNVERVARLTATGRMHPAGLAEVARAKADGRWLGDPPQDRRHPAGRAASAPSTARGDAGPRRSGAPAKRRLDS